MKLSTWPCPHHQLARARMTPPQVLIPFPHEARVALTLHKLPLIATSYIFAIQVATTYGIGRQKGR